MQFEDDESGLIQSAKNGDRNAFGRIYELYFEQVYRYVRSILTEQSDAEDTTAEVFIKVMRALPKYHEKGKFTAWLLRIARNETFNHLKKMKRRKEMPLFENVTIKNDNDPITKIEEYELVERTFQSMHLLTDLQREVLTLRFGENLSIRETAELMGRSISAVKFLQVSALRALRRQLGINEDRKEP